MHTCTYAFMHICTQTLMSTHSHMHIMCAYIHACMDTQMQTYIDTHARTHTHTQPVLTPILLAQCTSGSILIFTGHTASLLLLAQKPTPLLHAQLCKCREVVFSRLWLVFSNSSNNWTDEICYDYLCVSLFTKVSAPQEAG